ncbi:MAG TPA: hypothetical protein VED37_17015, partial [Ktedonobacteraceae bacterium]|nr:hypothetical protein [Ktedonobacteraceae bacterium]
MNWRSPSWWPFGRRGSRVSKGPEAALFQGLRIRLTLWYCLVLCAALVIFSVILYLGARYFLITPIEDMTSEHAHDHVYTLLAGAPDRACSTFGSPVRFGSPSPDHQGGAVFEMVACYDQNGMLVVTNETPLLPPAFLSNSLAKKALQTGWEADTVNTGGQIGRVYRVAQAVQNPNGKGYIGVVMVGNSIQVQQNALDLILILLL